MKRLFSIILALFMFMSLCSCTVLEEVMKKANLGGIPGLSGFSEAPIEILLGYVEGSEYGNGYKELARYKYPTFEITTANRAEYPELSHALSDFGEELKGYTMEEYDDLVVAAIDAEMNGWEMYDAYCVEYEAAVHRADSVATSIELLYSDYTGGVHGYHYIYGKNFNSKTGEEIKLSDVIADYDMFVSEGGGKLREMGDALFPEVDTQEVLSNIDELLWTLEPDGVTVYFTPYEIGPYASGVISVTLLESEFPGLMNKQYLNPLPYTCMEVLKWQDIRIDVTGDRVPEEISWSLTPMSMETDGEIRININDITYTELFSATEARGFFIRTKSGENILLIASEAYGREGEIRTYRLGNGVEKLSSVDVILEKVYQHGEWNIYGGRTLTNPYAFFAGKPHYLISAEMGYTQYTLTPEGNISRVGDVYIFPMEKRDTFKLMQELEVEKYNSGKGKITIPVGAYVTCYGEDENGYAYFIENERIYRVKVEKNDMINTINGTDIENIFEGLYHAP